MALHDSNGKLKIHVQLIEVFGRKIGWRQGDALSTAMFNISLKEEIRNIKTNLNGTIFIRTRQYVAYKDDVVMLGRSLRATEEVATQIKEAAVSTGLVISERKIKHIKININIRNQKRSDNELTIILEYLSP